MFFSNKCFVGYFAIFLWVLNGLPNTSIAYEKDKTYHLTILHTNDHHGAAWESEIGQAGLAARMTLIESIKKEVSQQGGEVLLLDAGDINTGEPLSEVLFAEPDIKGMNLMGYDAMAIGDHEFDNPLSVLKKQESWAAFPFLSANIYEKGTENRIFKPYTVLNKAGLKIAIIGLTTQDMTRFSYIEHTKNLEVRSPLDETLKVIDELHQSQSPDITIGLTHLGYRNTNRSDTKTQDDITLANALPTGTLDLIIGGHSHDVICKPKTQTQTQTQNSDNKIKDNCLPDVKNNTWIMQAGESGQYVGRADIKFINGQFMLVRYELIPVNHINSYLGPDDAPVQEFISSPITPSQKMLDLLETYHDEAENKVNYATVGFVDEALEISEDRINDKQSHLSQLLLKAMIEKTGADLAIIEPQNISSSLPANNISYVQIKYAFMPLEGFRIIDLNETKLVFVDLTAKELEDYLPVINENPNIRDRVLTLTNHSTLRDIKDNIKLNQHKIYRVATLQAYSSGDLGFAQINNHPNFVNTGLLISKVVRDYIEKHSPLKAADYKPTIE